MIFYIQQDQFFVDVIFILVFVLMGFLMHKAKKEFNAKLESHSKRLSDLEKKAK